MSQHGMDYVLTPWSADWSAGGKICLAYAAYQFREAGPFSRGRNFCVAAEELSFHGNLTFIKCSQKPFTSPCPRPDKRSSKQSV
jgi:hypothetical protein